MTKDKAYELIDGTISEIAEDFWDTSTGSETLLKDMGYLLGFADGVRKAIQRGGVDERRIELEQAMCMVHEQQTRVDS